MGGLEINNVDDIKAAAREVEKGELHPLELGQAITSLRRPDGQPAFFLIPTAESMDLRKPGTPLTMIDPDGNFVKPELYVPGERRGMRHTVCAMLDPRTGMLAVSDPNIPGQRMSLGGAGVTRSNRSQLERGASSWRYPRFGGPAIVALHPIIVQFGEEYPDKPIGYTDVVASNDAMQPMPESRRVPGHYYSEEPLQTVASYPVTWRTLQAVGDIQLISF